MDRPSDSQGALGALSPGSEARPAGESAGSAIAAAISLAPGDLVIHTDYGLGRLERLVSLDGRGEFFEIAYRNSTLLVPVADAGLLSRFGAASADVKLDRLGGKSWGQRRGRAVRRIAAMARQLVGIAARRALAAAPVMKVGTEDDAAFAETVPFELTFDQRAAIEAVERDLASGRPMDRLLCGDVGSGKTEVALRAAFTAARAGQQVAVVVPTTLLARQHCETFGQRLSRWPIRIAQISRLGPSSKAAIADLAAGRVDVVIGTHALLGSGIAFQNLGLLIIDEEHRFGVAHKERLKQLREGVHVLTLTATPIPRTLQLALAPVRELSLIRTPPPRRKPVETVISRSEPAEIASALMREHARGGQSFYVCPRIADLAGRADMLAAHVPELRVAKVHGRMKAGELERIMQAFDQRQFDVLLTTTIIESGLDISSANTLIVHDAHKLGLAQLYQLRGRIGRSDVQAFALFTIPADEEIGVAARQRLDVIAALGTVGAGISLAGHDMDIRGAGNILGEEQSGHLREIGFDLFQRLLERAIAALRRGDENDWAAVWTPRLELGIPGRIPETYVPDERERLDIYWRTGHLDGERAIDGLAGEVETRHGALPPQVRRLIELAAVRASCIEADVAELKVGPKGAILAARKQSPRLSALAEKVSQNLGPARIDRRGRVVVKAASSSAEARLDLARLLLASYAEANTGLPEPCPNAASSARFGTS